MKLWQFSTLIFLVMLLFSFVIIGLLTNPQPIVINAWEWINSNPILTLLGISEGAALLSPKFRGILQSILKILQLLLDNSNDSNK